MKHRKHVFKIGRTSSHNRCLMANMLKDLLVKEKIETTVAKAKELSRQLDKIVTCAKKDTIEARRQVKAKLMIRYNKLSTKVARKIKNPETEDKQLTFNTDRKVLKKLFDLLSTTFAERKSGYARIIKRENRRGDKASLCVISLVS